MICVQKTEEREKKEVTATNGLVDELIDQLSVKTVFTIPIFGGIKIAESVVVMWIIMAIVIVASIFLTRSVENPGKRQLFLEVCIGKFYGFFEGLLGEEGKCYIPYLMSVGLFIGIANVIGLFGFKPPTKDLNCTIALALMSIILVEAAGIRAKGVKKWACRDYYTDQHSGDFYPTVFVMFTTVRKCTRSVRYHGADQGGCADGCTAGI